MPNVNVQLYLVQQASSRPSSRNVIQERPCASRQRQVTRCAASTPYAMLNRCIQPRLTQVKFMLEFAQHFIVKPALMSQLQSGLPLHLAEAREKP